MLSARMPAVFVGHGNPMNAIVDNQFHRSWRALGQRLPLPRAVLCVSAHWETEGVCVTAASAAPTIHDFYGFPDALARFSYPAPGAPVLAQRVATLLSAKGAAGNTSSVYLERTRGLDHGAWSVLCAMYPDASIPVLQLSLDTRATGVQHYEMARLLAPLRDEGVLILGSGNWVHNLRLFDFNNPTPLPWATECDEEIKQYLRAGNHVALCAFQSLRNYRLAIPSSEHYLPLLYTIGVQAPEDTVTFFNESVLSAISMTSIVLSEQTDLQPLVHARRKSAVLE